MRVECVLRTGTNWDYASNLLSLERVPYLALPAVEIFFSLSSVKLLLQVQYPTYSLPTRVQGGTPYESRTYWYIQELQFNQFLQY